MGRWHRGFLANDRSCVRWSWNYFVWQWLKQTKWGCLHRCDLCKCNSNNLWWSYWSYHSVTAHTDQMVLGYEWCYFERIRQLKDSNNNICGNHHSVRKSRCTSWIPVATVQIETIATAKKVMAFGDMSKYFIREVSGFNLTAQILRLQILSLSEFIELMETLWTQMQLKEWLWASPNYFLYLATELWLGIEAHLCPSYSTRRSQWINKRRSNEDQNACRNDWLYNGKPIPKKDEIWETDKKMLLILLKRDGLKQLSLLLRRKLINQLGKKNLCPITMAKKEKEKGSKRKMIDIQLNGTQHIYKDSKGESM